MNPILSRRVENVAICVLAGAMVACAGAASPRGVLACVVGLGVIAWCTEKW